jgi:hypothetical protein
MARKEVIDAVRARLEDNWDSGDAPIYDANSEGSIPTDAGAFIVLQFPVSETTRWPLNQRYYREEGGFRIVIHTARGSGDQQAHEFADTLSDIFRDQTFDGVQCGVPSTPLFDDENDRGLYYVTSVVVPYTFNFQD